MLGLLQVVGLETRAKDTPGGVGGGIPAFRNASAQTVMVALFAYLINNYIRGHTWLDSGNICVIANTGSPSTPIRMIVS